MENTFAVIRLPEDERCPLTVTPNMHSFPLSRRLVSRAFKRSFASRASAPGLRKLLEKRPGDVVITFAKRTAMGRPKKGQFKDAPVDEILSGLLKVSARFNF